MIGSITLAPPARELRRARFVISAFAGMTRRRFYTRLTSPARPVPAGRPRRLAGRAAVL